MEGEIGHVYCLENKHHPGIIKIGFTDRDPLVRAREISSGTGVLGEWRLVWARECIAPRMCEFDVHQALARYRVSKNREFFRCDVATAKKEIERSADAFLRKRYRVRKQRRYGRPSMMKYLWLAASLCALAAAVTHPTSAWIIADRVFRVMISIGYMGHHPHY